jgi:hypothetical protein
MGDIVALFWNPGPLVLELCRKPLKRSSSKWPPGYWSYSDHPGSCARASLTVCAATVQQPKQISWKLEKGFLARMLIGRCFASTRNDEQTILLLPHGRGRQFDRASPANEDGP